jgi:hypothetical protein
MDVVKQLFHIDHHRLTFSSSIATFPQPPILLYHILLTFCYRGLLVLCYVVNKRDHCISLITRLRVVRELWLGSANIIMCGGKQQQGVA